MEVILQEKIHNLGDLGDQVKVKAGYGRNYLIPQGKAVPATPDNVAKFEARRAELEKAQAEQLAEAQKRAEKIHGLKLTIPRKVAAEGDEGKLYGSVAPGDIVDAAEAVPPSMNCICRKARFARPANTNITSACMPTLSARSRSSSFPKATPDPAGGFRRYDDNSGRLRPAAITPGLFNAVPAFNLH